MREVLHMGRGTVALIGFLSVGLLLINPVGLYYNLLWLGRSDGAEGLRERRDEGPPRGPEARDEC